MFSKIIFILLAVIFQFQNSYSQGSWQWQNPYPQGKNLKAVKFLDQNTGIACGDNGTIIRTTDGGTTWTVTTIPERNNLSAIFFTDMLTGFIVPGPSPGSIKSYYIQKTTDAGLSWQAINTGVLKSYTGISFVNQNTGYACGEFGTLIKTTNAGENWTEIYNAPPRFYGISFPDENNGYLLGDNSAVLKTTNGGNNWEAVTRIPQNSARSIFFTDSVTGYGVGVYDGLFKTTNSGLTWFSQGSFPGNQIFFINNNKGWVIGSSGDLHLTTNAGNNWYYFSLGLNVSTSSINFADETYGYVVGTNGRIWKSNVAGFIWTQVSTSFTYNSLFGVSFVNSLTGFVMGAYGVFLKTTNAGNNWSATTTITSNSWDLGHQSFLNENTGYVIGDSSIFKGKLFKTTNGGNNWGTVYNTATYSSFNYLVSSYFSDTQTGFIVSTHYNRDSSRIFKTTNGGSNWQEVLKVNSFLKGICFANSSTGFCASDNGTIFKSTNGGSDWLPDDSLPANSFYFPTHQIGYTVGPNGTAFKTTNTGDTWMSLNTGVASSYYMNSSYFTDENTGYAIGNTPAPVVSVIIKTTDGGHNWSILDSTHHGGLYGISFSSSTSGYIVGVNGTILKTTDGLTFTTSQEESMPDNYFLAQNYPNPFNPSTKINFSIPKQSIVSIKVYDGIGKEVMTLVNESKAPGNYEVEFNAVNISSGIYYYRIETADFIETKKMLLLK